MTNNVTPTQADIDAAEGLGCITEERQSIVEKAFARHRLAIEATQAAEIARLREALGQIAEEASVSVSDDKYMYKKWREIATSRIDIARTTLEQKPWPTLK